jgi:membrane dipeptidase
MSKNPYTSYSYLPSGEDCTSIKLAPELNRVPAYDGSLTPEQAEHSKKLMNENITISLHDHPVRFPNDMRQTPEYNRTGRQHTAFEGVKASGMTVIFDNMMDGTACVTGNAPWRWLDIITDIGMRQADIAHQDDVIVIRTLADIHFAKKAGKVGFVFGLEASTPIENEIDRLDVLYGLGIRQLGIAYSDSNSLASGLNEEVDGGLTSFGARCTTRMNQLGIAVDVSHSSDQTSIDVAKVSTKPIFMTHAGAKAIWPIRRMKSDDALKAVAQTGGVIGMSAAPHTTLSKGNPLHSIDSVMDHLMYCIDLVGIDHVAFGPDTLYGDHVGLHTVFSGLLGTAFKDAPPFEKVKYVNGLENPTENFWNISGWLVKNGFSDQDIIAILGGNIMRALEEIWIK